MGQERRAHERYPVRLEVRIESVNAFLEEHTRDISRGGIFVETEKPLQPNSLVALAFYLPGENEPLEIDGRVAHHRPADNGNARGMGVQFITLTTKGRDRLEEFLKHLQDGELIA